MSAQSARQQHLFIVRMWQEPSCSLPPGQWRGSAEHVPTGERLYFCSLGDLSGFMARLVDAPSDNAAPASREIGRDLDE